MSDKRKYRYGKHAPSQQGDEQDGEYTRAHLAKMDQQFVERMEWAIRTGREARPEGVGTPRRR
jgi:ribosomal protein L32